MAETMRIEKVINNNLVRSRKDGKEIMVMGKGVGFQKKKNDPIDVSAVERVYVVESTEGRNQLEEFLTRIPYPYVQTANQVIDYCRQELNKRLDDSIWLGLTDHLYYAIQRARQGIRVRNGLLWEISRYYAPEYKVAQEALRMVEKKHGVDLPDSEAGFIALHLVNAQMNDRVKLQETMQMTERIRESLKIVKYHYNIELNEESLYYERFVTHIKYFVRRMVTGKRAAKEDLGFLEVVKMKYPNEYKCAQKIEKYVQTEMGATLSEDELIYLSIHIRRVTEESM